MTGVICKCREQTMKQRELLDILHMAEMLKCRERHGWTSSGRRESVAEHTFRMAFMVLLLEDEFPELDMQKVMRLALLHDLGEAITGDIPTFEKTGADERTEEQAILQYLDSLSEPVAERLRPLMQEALAPTTPEGRLCKAIDKIEAVIQHNEGPIDTWLPLEYDLQLTYGVKECESFPYMKLLRELVSEDAKKKMREELHP